MLQISFETMEEQQAFIKELNGKMDCAVCKAFSVPCMCKLCAYKASCSENKICGCGDYFVKQINKQQKGGAA